MYAPTNPAYYPSTSLDYVNAPVLDQQRSFLVSGKQGSREPLYLDDQNRRNTNYEVRPPQGKIYKGLDGRNCCKYQTLT